MAEAEVVKKRPFELSFSVGDSYAGFEDILVPSDIEPILTYAKTVYHNGVDKSLVVNLPTVDSTSYSKSTFWLRNESGTYYLYVTDGTTTKKVALSSV